MSNVKDIGEHIVARVQELVGMPTPWHRALWNVGLCLRLDELLEASECLAQGMLSEQTLERMVSACKRVVGEDLAVTPSERSVICGALKSIPRHRGVDFQCLRDMQRRLSDQYLLRLATTFKDRPAVDLEQAASAIASFLLDASHSEEALHSWFKARRTDVRNGMSLSDLCEAAHHELAATGNRTFLVLVAFGRAPKMADGYPAEWLGKSEVASWLHGNKSSTTGLRIEGGLVLTLQAKDSHAAARQAIALTDGYESRHVIATGHSIAPLKSVWVEGIAEPFSHTSHQRGVRVKVLYRHNQIFQSSQMGSVDAAMELLAHLEGQSPAAAVAGGWAAIEALLGEPNNRSSAAENLAYLVACSLPRSELTALSYTIEKCWKDQAERFKGLDANKDRAQVVISCLINDQARGLPSLSDNAAISRMRALLANPNKRLHQLHSDICDAFLRLYRQRNLVLHGGMTTSVSLASTLRTVSKLAGAGIDRVAHAHYVQGIKPLELVGRAKVSMSLVDGSDPYACISLLER